MLDGVVPWPPELAHRYRARGYWAGTTLGQAWDRSASDHADRVAVVDGARGVTYRELAARVDRLAVHLALRGVRGGTRAIFQLPNSLELVVAYLACLKVGAIPITCPLEHRHGEIGSLARLTGAAAWFLPDEADGFDHVTMAEELRGELPTLREIVVAGDRTGAGMTRLADLLGDPVESRTPPGSLGRLRPGARDVAVFQLAEGTTGPPRIVPRTHDDYRYTSLQVARVTGLDRESVLLLSAPAVRHVPLACPGVQGALLLGARVVLAPSPDPETTFRLVETERVTWIAATPEAVLGWLRAPGRGRRALGSLRRLYVGGARPDAAVARAAHEAVGPIVQQLYAITEGLVCATRSDDPVEVSLETHGRPVSPDDELRVVDEHGQTVPPGAIGELQCRGPCTIPGYYRAPAHNRTAFTPDGFFRTGDRARLHPSGNLIVEAVRPATAPRRRS